jgi:hypothetical protein
VSEARDIAVCPTANPDGTRRYVVLWSTGRLATGNGAALPTSSANTPTSYFTSGIDSSTPWTFDRFTLLNGGEIGRRLYIYNWSTMSGWVADGWGRLWPLGDAPAAGTPAQPLPYWGPNYFTGAQGGDILRAIQMSPTNLGGGYILDMLGPVHTFGGQSGTQGVVSSYPQFGFDIARDLAVDFATLHMLVLDGYGGLHRFGGGWNASTPLDAPISFAHPGYDIMRSLSVNFTTGQGHVLDGWGGTVPFGVGGAAAPEYAFNGPYHYGWDIMRSLYWFAETMDLGPGGTTKKFYVLDGLGSVTPWDALETPVVSVTGPADPVTTTSQPTITWSVTPSGVVQAAWEVIVYPASVYNAAGFKPKQITGAAFRDTDYGTDTSVVVSPEELVDGTTYRAYVRVTSSDGLKSAFGSSAPFKQFTTAFARPTTPVLTATPNVANQYVQLQANAAAGSGHVFEFQFSDDNANWYSVAGAHRTSAQSVNDYEAPIGSLRYYRLRRIKLSPFLASNYATASATLTAGAGLASWFLKDLVDPSLNVALKTAEREYSLVEPQGVFYPPGSDLAVVVTPGVKGTVQTLTVRSLDKATFDALVKILRRRQTLLLQSIWGENYYVWPSKRDASMYKNLAPGAHVHDWTITFTQVGRPPVVG